MARAIFMTCFDYKNRKLTTGLHLLGVLLILAGIFALSTPFYLNPATTLERIVGVGSSAILLGVFITFCYTGILIDFKGRKYKTYFNIGWYKTGEWIQLPADLTIDFLKITYKGRSTSNGVSPTFSGKVKVYIIHIRSSQDEKILSFEYESKQKAHRKLEELKAGLSPK